MHNELRTELLPDHGTRSPFRDVPSTHRASTHADEKSRHHRMNEAGTDRRSESTHTKRLSSFPILAAKQIPDRSCCGMSLDWTASTT
jgi:hypothetical protein